MRQILEYKNCITLLLMTALFLGCGRQEHSDNKLISSTQSENLHNSLETIKNSEDKINIIKEKTDKNSEDIKNIKTNISKIDKQVNESSADPIILFFVSIIINIIILIIAGFLLLLFLKRNASKNRNKKTNKSSENKNLEKKVENLSNQIWELKKDLNNVKRKIKSLENKKLEKMSAEIKGEKEATSDPNETKPTANNKRPTEYLSGFNGKSFTIVDTTPDGSFFEMKNQKGDTAEYTFHGSDEEAIAKRIFDEQISKTLSGSQKSAKKVEVVNLGEIKLVNSSWEVTKPIEIKLI